ncbi:hypothetical protein [Nocardioides flavescens]|uniref:Heparan-alpha-glucosaminide N-acetyltransferase catalytic domain-containing protein n=1 Tax=Nocardioides flavescens TaxID=2691959 RepID=A0A6L7EQ71_9ACTN|nr:hypothetical protein [Nocardioides flavescens]MXG89537.1 hypothetical protein [Nocardioides flavescens]
MPTGGGAARLVGLDVARCLALLGMVAAHVLDDSPLVDGRASALFAVLAGVSLVLLDRRTTRRGIAVRAVLIALLGLALGELDTGIAVILTYYGVLFVLGLPFLRLPARVLWPLAALWAVAAPVGSYLLRPELPERQTASPAFDQLAEPGHLLSELLFTGYYPAGVWLAYLLLGLAIGRSDLRSPVLQARLVALGAPLALAAYAVSRVLTAQPGLARVEVGETFYGTTPTGDGAAWLLVVAPHSGTPFDLLQTGGCAMAVIGLCLLVAGALPPGGTRPLAVLFGAGTMTLTLYTLHVVMRTDRVWPAEEPGSYGWHVLVLVVIGAAFVAARRRGPLESVLARAGASLGSRP